MGEKMQRRLLSLTVVATFVALQIPLKRLVKELVPGNRGTKEDVTEALVQGAARTAAVIIASTIVRGLADSDGPSSESASRKDRSAQEGALEVTLDQ